MDIPRTNVVYKDIKLDCDKTVDPISAPSIEFENITYSIKECKKQGDALRVVLSITSKDDTQLFIAGNNYGDKSTMVFDNLGNSYKVEAMKISNQPFDEYFGRKIIQDTPTEMTLLFNGLKPNSTLISLQLSIGRANKQLMFRKISI